MYNLVSGCVFRIGKRDLLQYLSLPAIQVFCVLFLFGLFICSNSAEWMQYAMNVWINQIDNMENERKWKKEHDH